MTSQAPLLLWCERASQTLSAGTRLKEGCHINRSLLTLGTVIRKLSKVLRLGIPQVLVVVPMKIVTEVLLFRTSVKCLWHLGMSLRKLVGRLGGHLFTILLLLLMAPLSC